MIFSRRNQKDSNSAVKSGPAETYLSIDIGTEYVKTCLCTQVVDQIEILGYSKERQKESSMYAAFILNIDEVVDTVDKSIGKAYRMAKNLNPNISAPKSAYLGIAGELVKGVTIEVDLQRKNPESRITAKEMQDFVTKIKKHTFVNTVNEISEEIGISSNQIKELDTNINAVYIDGVKVLNPVGYSGTEILYKVFSTFAPKIHIESINQVAKKLSLIVKDIVVEPYAVALGMKGLRDPNADAIIIDIGGGTTDVAIVKNGDIAGTKMFAIGGRVFTKRIQKELGKTYEESEQIKINYANGELDKATTSQIAKYYEEDISTWLTGIEIALEGFEDIGEYPSNIYLCGGGALLPEIQESLMTYPWLHSLNFKKFPKINFIFPTNIKGIVDRTKSATLPSDVAPVSLARMILEK